MNNNLIRTITLVARYKTLRSECLGILLCVSTSDAIVFVYVEQSGYVHLASGWYDVAKSRLCQIWHRDDGCLPRPATA